MTEIVTRITKLQADAYMREMFPRYMQKRWYWFVLPAVPFVGLSFADLRFLYVALMAICLVTPLLLGYVYFYYALGEECVASVRRGRVRFSEAGVAREFLDDDDRPIGLRFYGWDEFGGYSVSSKFLKLFLRRKSFLFQLVPIEALPETDDRKKVFKLLSDRLPVDGFEEEKEA